MSQAKQLHHLLYRELRALLPLVWPVFSVLLGLMASLGLLIGHLEGWRLPEGIYFAFVTGLTVGYGDLVPKLPLPRPRHRHRLHGHPAHRARRRDRRARPACRPAGEGRPRPIPNGHHEPFSRAAAPAC